MQIEFESPSYAWHYDSFFGVGRFERKSDGAITLLETGTECQDMRRQLRRLWQKEVREETRDAVFNCIASEYSYDDE